MSLEAKAGTGKDLVLYLPWFVTASFSLADLSGSLGFLPGATKLDYSGGEAPIKICALSGVMVMINENFLGF